MTDSGDNDTSVQNARPAGNPAEVRFPMMTARNCQSVRGIKHYHKLLCITLLRKKRTFDG